MTVPASPEPTEKSVADDGPSASDAVPHVEPCSPQNTPDAHALPQPFPIREQMLPVNAFDFDPFMQMPIPYGTAGPYQPPPMPNVPPHTREDSDRQPWRYRGYPAFSKWMGSSNEFFVLRRFGDLNARVLLLLQDRIVRLEEQLEYEDKMALLAPNELADSGTFRDDMRPERERILDDLTWQLEKYSRPPPFLLFYRVSNPVSHTISRLSLIRICLANIALRQSHNISLSTQSPAASNKKRSYQRPKLVPQQFPAHQARRS